MKSTNSGIWQQVANSPRNVLSWSYGFSLSNLGHLGLDSSFSSEQRLPTTRFKGSNREGSSKGYDLQPCKGMHQVSVTLYKRVLIFDRSCLSLSSFVKATKPFRNSVMQGIWLSPIQECHLWLKFPSIPSISTLNCLLKGTCTTNCRSDSLMNAC